MRKFNSINKILCNCGIANMHTYIYSNSICIRFSVQIPIAAKAKKNSTYMSAVGRRSAGRRHSNLTGSIYCIKSVSFFIEIFSKCIKIVAPEAKSIS